MRFRNISPLALGFVAVMLMFFVVGGGFGADPAGYLMDTLLTLPGILIGLSFHEYAHAKVAYKLGDPTPKMEGRVTISPFAHIDIVGFISLMFIGFGWGKPVMINPMNFKNRRRSELLVSLAGVTMNLILALVFTVIYGILFKTAGLTMAMGGVEGALMTIIFYCVYINIVLMFFNLLPIPPLDGFNVITEIFDLKNTTWWYRVYDKGFFILMLFIVMDFTDRILNPLVMNTIYLLTNITPFF